MPRSSQGESGWSIDAAPWPPEARVSPRRVMRRRWPGWPCAMMTAGNDPSAGAMSRAARPLRVISVSPSRGRARQVTPGGVSGAAGYRTSPVIARSWMGGSPSSVVLTMAVRLSSVKLGVRTPTGWAPKGGQLGRVGPDEVDPLLVFPNRLAGSVQAGLLGLRRGRQGKPHRGGDHEMLQRASSQACITMGSLAVARGCDRDGPSAPASKKRPARCGLPSGPLLLSSSGLVERGGRSG
jgi:hypothetical protein